MNIKSKNCSSPVGGEYVIAYRSYLGLLKQGDIDEHIVYREKALRLARAHDLPIEPILQAERLGATRRFEELLALIEEGRVMYASEAREWAQTYKLSCDRLEQAVKTGLMHSN